MKPIRLIQTFVKYYDSDGFYQRNVYKARYNGQELDVVSDTINFLRESPKLIETIVKYNDGTADHQDNIYKTRLYGKEVTLRFRSQGEFEFAHVNFLIKQHDVGRMLELSQEAYVINSPGSLDDIEEYFEDRKRSSNMLYTPENSPFCRMYVDKISDYPPDAVHKLTWYGHSATLIDSNGDKHSYEIICDDDAARYCRVWGGALGIRLSNNAVVLKYADDVYVEHSNVESTIRQVFRINPDTGAAEKACYAKLEAKNDDAVRK